MAGRTLLPLPTAALEAVGDPFGADVLPPVEVYLPEVLGLAELSEVAPRAPKAFMER
jgi:hypothetical protein